MTVKRQVGILVSLIVVASFSIVWAAGDEGLTRIEEGIPWRMVAIGAITLFAAGAWRWADRVTKILDKHETDIAILKAHLGLNGRTGESDD